MLGRSPKYCNDLRYFVTERLSVTPTPAANDHATPSALEVIGSARSMRYLRSDPVPDDLLEKLVWAGTRAPSPVNTQPWHFVVVRDRERIRRLARAVAEGLAARQAARADGRPPSSSGAHLSATLAEVPALIVVAAELSYPREEPEELYAWACVFPASQNILLAARALGLGAAFTTYHHFAEQAFRDELAIPDEVRIGTVIPVGWPDRSFGPVRRRPVADVIHHDVWDATKTGSWARESTT
jgi:nitroreductase